MLGEIVNITKNDISRIDRTNSNPYRIVFTESDEFKRAYYFTCPIYNKDTRKMIIKKFYKENNGFSFYGSNAKILIDKKIAMENEEGACEIEIFKAPVQSKGEILVCEKDEIYPTTNGLAIKLFVGTEQERSFFIKMKPSFSHVKGNDKYFSIMKKENRPFVTISNIGCIDNLGKIKSAARITGIRVDDCSWEISLSKTNKETEYVFFEINLYENKLIQDTTVESLHPNINNVFGSVAFLGETTMFGEQCLYLKIDYSRVEEIFNKKIDKVKLHIPVLNNYIGTLEMYKIDARFCSFGLNWNNKNSKEIFVGETSFNNGYESIDITSQIVDKDSKQLLILEGLILKNKAKKGVCVVSTADSSYAPPILEIRYK